jgi:hypothetical protein
LCVSPSTNAKAEAVRSVSEQQITGINNTYKTDSNVLLESIRPLAMAVTSATDILAHSNALQSIIPGPIKMDLLDLVP